MTAPDRPGDLLAGRCDHTTADCTHDRPGDRDQQQAAEFWHLMVGDSAAGAVCGCGWRGPRDDHSAHVNGRAQLALAAARAEEAARWRAKIEALAAKREAGWYVSADDIRAMLDET